MLSYCYYLLELIKVNSLAVTYGMTSYFIFNSDITSLLGTKHVSKQYSQDGWGGALEVSTDESNYKI